LATERELSDFLRSVEKRAFKRSVYHVRDEEAALDIVQDSMMKLAEHYGTSRQRAADAVPAHPVELHARLVPAAEDAQCPVFEHERLRIGLGRRRFRPPGNL
jgi:hypothetical protein